MSAPHGVQWLILTMAIYVSVVEPLPAQEKPWSKTSMSGVRRGLSMTQDGRLLAVISQDGGTMRLWETMKDKEFPRAFEFPGLPHEVLLSHDGKLLTAARESVLVWDVASG